MNCKDVRQELSLGRPISDGAAEHVQSCAGCGRMMEALRTPADMPGQAKISAIQDSLIANLQPVRPLPSNGKLILLALLFFVVFVNAVTMLFGYQGFAHMSVMQKTFYGATILLLGIAFIKAISEQLIPGQRARIGVVWPIVGSIVVLALLVSGFFPQFDTDRFVERGIPCLWLGMACAAVYCLLEYPFVRRGFAPSPVLAGAIVAGFGGLAGVGVLALHCPLQNAAHIMVWHLGAIALSAAAGLLLVRLAQSVRR